jgi:MFS transporter, ACS family, tartrate transporter
MLLPGASADHCHPRAMPSTTGNPTESPLRSVHPDVGQTALRKIGLRLIPFLLACFTVAWIDRVNVGFAALQMNRALGFSAAVYGFGAGVFFLGYALCEVPSNLILYRVGARRWLARIMVTWGVIASAMLFVRGPTSFYLSRFLLGVAEAGFFPGIVYYIGGWFPLAQRARAIGAFMTAIPISAVAGGPLAGILLTLDGRVGLAGWQWLFLLEGIPAVVLGFTLLKILPDRPADAHWLTHDEQGWLTQRLREDETSERPPHQVTFRAALAHPLVWHLGIIYFMGSVGSYGLTLWLPELLHSLSGLSALRVGLLSAVPYLVAAVGTVLIAMHSDRTRERRLHAAVPCILAALGFLGSALTTSPVFSLGLITLAAVGIYGRTGPFWAMPTQLLTGRAAAGGLAFINTVAAIGGFVGPYAVGLIKRSTGSFTGGLAFLGLSMLAAAVLTLPLRVQAQPQAGSQAR